MRSPLALFALLGAACTTGPVPARHSTAGQGAPSTDRPAVAQGCRASPLSAAALSPGILEAARSHRGHGPQFLQAAPPRSSVWFDLLDLERPLDLAADATPVAVTRTTVWVVLQDGALALIRRGQNGMTSLPLKLWPAEVVETDAGEAWALARSSAARPAAAIDGADEVWLLHIDSKGKHEVRSLGPAAPRAMRLVLTAEGRPALVVARTSGARLTLQVSWSLDPSKVVEVDSVTVGERLAEHSERTGIELAAAAEGPQNIAIAWRPLTAEGAREGSADIVPVAAEVRWLAVTPAGAAGALSRHRSAVRQLDATTGIGPHPPVTIQLRAHSHGGQAMFAWFDDEMVVGARATAAGGAALAPRAGAGWLGFGNGETESTLVLVDADPLRISRFRVSCE